MFLSATVITAEATSAAVESTNNIMSNLLNPTLVMIIGASVAGILAITGIWLLVRSFSKGAQQNVSPTSWVQEEVKDLAIIIEGLNNTDPHPYIRDAYVGSKSLANSLDFDTVYSNAKSLQGRVLVHSLAYQELKGLIGANNESFFSKWKDFLALNGSSKNFSENLVKKSMAFYICADKLYLISKFNSIRTDLISSPSVTLLQTDPTNFFKEPIWLNLIDAFNWSLGLVSIYARFQGALVTVDVPNFPTQQDISNELGTNGASGASNLINNTAQGMINYLNNAILESVLTPFIS